MIKNPVDGEDELRKPEVHFHINKFVRSVTQAERALLLLDYDGTLAPFRVKRNQALPYPGIAPLLEEFVRSDHTRVVIISGRDTSETIPLLGVTPAPEVWGLHGLQRRKPGEAVGIVRIEERYLDALSDAGRWLDCQHLQHTAEYKAGSIAVHWRGLSDLEAEEMRGRVLVGWRLVVKHSGLELLEFDGGIEIRVPGADKGDVVRLVLSEMDPGTPVAYLGDDATDERASRAIDDRGLTVLVRPRWRPTAAQLWLRPPEELVEFLTLWLEALRGRADSRGGEPMMNTAVAAVQPVPAKPFYFNTSAHLLRITEYKANTLADLLDALRKCPEESIFQHTFRTLQEHHFLRAGFSNDFAHWVLAACNEPGLAEALASVDVRAFTSVAELRTRFVQILESDLLQNASAGVRSADEAFYFCASDIVVMPTSFQAHTLHEFAEGIRNVSLHSIHHHFIEARLRLKLMSNDFSQWLHEDAGLTDAARSLNRIDIYTATLEDVREQIVRIVERALT